MTVNGDSDARGSDDEHPGKQEFPGQIGMDARDPEQLNARQRRDHGVDGEPADAQKEGQDGTRIGTAVAEDAPGEDDLRQAAFRSSVAEKAENHRPGQRANQHRQQPVPNAQPVIGRQQARGQEAGVIDERARPEKAQFRRTAVSLGVRNGVDAVRLDLEKGI